MNENNSQRETVNDRAVNDRIENDRAASDLTDEERLDAETAAQLIQRLLLWDALEIGSNTRQGQVLIPYVMNDAVECYLVLENVKMQGTLVRSELPGTILTCVRDGSREGFIFRQGSGNTCVLWFSELRLKRKCYQYHMIGHSWRKKKGEEYHRRLVNLVCVLHDKLNYLGEEYCAPEEIRIGRLAEFAPLLTISPINESILEWYPHTDKGISAVLALAAQVHDEILYIRLCQYRDQFVHGKVRKAQIEAMRALLLEPAHARFWICLEQMIDDAGKGMELRTYGRNADTEAKRRRAMIVNKYAALGFQGKYPLLQRRDGWGQVLETVRFSEEQPFTVMEEKGFMYRIFSLRYYADQIRDAVWTMEDEWKHTTIIN